MTISQFTWKCPHCGIKFEARDAYELKEKQNDHRHACESSADNFLSPFTFFKDQFGEVFAFVNIKDIDSTARFHCEVVPVDSKKFKELVTFLLYKKSSEKLTENKINEIVLSSKAIAIDRKLFFKLYLRVAEKDEKYWFDLCNDAWEAVRITPGIWEVLTPTTPIFRRYSHMKEIKVAESGTSADLDELVSYLNISNENDKLLYKVMLASMIVPGIPHVIFMPIGAHGSAKSTLFEATRRLIDNSETLMLSLGRDQNQIVQQMQHNYLPYYDNVHSLQQWQSDMFCRAATGEGFTKRVLFTDDDDKIYKYMRCTGLNGINVPGAQPDLLDRALMLKLERIDKTKRRLKSEIDANLNRLSPRTLAYLFEMVAQAMLKIKEGSIKLTELPRMADFALWGEAIARSMGYPEMAFIDAYMENVGKQSIEAVEGNIVGEAILKFFEGKDDWTGSPSELLTALNETVNPQTTKEKEWPKAPHILMRKINLIKPSIQDLGVYITDTRVSKGRLMNISRTLKQTKLVNNIATDDATDVAMTLKKSSDMGSDMGISPHKDCQNVANVATLQKGGIEMGLPRRGDDATIKIVEGQESSVISVIATLPEVSNHVATEKVATQGGEGGIPSLDVHNSIVNLRKAVRNLKNEHRSCRDAYNELRKWVEFKNTSFVQFEEAWAECV